MCRRVASIAPPVTLALVVSCAPPEKAYRCETSADCVEGWECVASICTDRGGRKDSWERRSNDIGKPCESDAHCQFICGADKSCHGWEYMDVERAASKDAPVRSGSQIDVAIDSGGIIYLAYFVESEKAPDRFDLHLATRKDAWQIDTLAYAIWPKCTALSLALGPDGTPRVAFLAWDEVTKTQTLRYVSKRDGAFAIDTLDAFERHCNLQGDGVSLAVDAAGDAHLAYTRDTYQDPTDRLESPYRARELRLFSQSGGQWPAHSEIVADVGSFGATVVYEFERAPSLTLAADGHPTVAFVTNEVTGTDPIKTFTKRLRIATRENASSTWSFQEIDHTTSYFLYPDLKTDAAGVQGLVYAVRSRDYDVRIAFPNAANPDARAPRPYIPAVPILGGLRLAFSPNRYPGLALMSNLQSYGIVYDAGDPRVLLFEKSAVSKTYPAITFDPDGRSVFAYDSNGLVRVARYK